MRKYLKIMEVGMKEFFVWKSNLFTELFLVLTDVLLLSFIWGTLFGYSKELIIYFSIIHFFIFPLSIYYEIMSKYERIVWEGYSLALGKPVSFFLYVAGRCLGNALPKIIISWIIGTVLLVFLGINIYGIIYFLFLLPLILIYYLSLGYLLGGIVFFTYSGWGFSTVYSILEMFLGGGGIPFIKYGKNVPNLLTGLPFVWHIYFPAYVLISGDFSTFVLTSSVIFAFTFVFFIVGKILNEKGLKRFEALGG